MTDSYIGASIKNDRTFERSISFIRVTWQFYWLWFLTIWRRQLPLTPRPIYMSLAMDSRLALFFTAFIIPLCNAVTLYYQPGQTPLAEATSTAAGAAYTGLAAYNPLVLTPPPPPGPANFTTQFSLPLTNAVPSQASIQQSGSFFGFSVEMSVVNQVCESKHLDF